MTEFVTSAESPLSVSLIDLRRVTEVGLTEVNGKLALLIQRLDQVDQRDREQSQQVAQLTGRIEMLERNGVTHDQLTARTQRLYMLLGAVAGLLGVAVAIVGLVLGGS